MKTTTFKTGGSALKLKLLITGLTVVFTTLTASRSSAQDNRPNHPQQHYGDFGNTLNIGFGYIYSDASGLIPIIMANYEFDVAKDFTLAPFLGYGSYTSADDYAYYNNYGYYYRETIIPIGIKGTYYFNRLLDLNRRWDIYAGASLGYVYDKITWQDGYEGGTHATNSPVFLDLHVGAEYHVTRRFGIFLDLAGGNSSVSTVGFAFHHR